MFSCKVGICIVQGFVPEPYDFMASFTGGKSRRNLSQFYPPIVNLHKEYTKYAKYRNDLLHSPSSRHPITQTTRYSDIPSPDRSLFRQQNISTAQCCNYPFGSSIFQTYSFFIKQGQEKVAMLNITISNEICCFTS